MGLRMGTRVGSLPPEANNKGTSNEGPPAEQRSPESSAPVTEGPRQGETGEYKPATYKLASGNKRTDR